MIKPTLDDLARRRARSSPPPVYAESWQAELGEVLEAILRRNNERDQHVVDRIQPSPG